MPATPTTPIHSGPAPEWRNWQTRRIQNPLAARSCGFESHLRYLPSSRPAKPALALLQHACSADANENLATAERLARRAAAEGADWIVTQELFTTLYFPQTEDPANFDAAEPLPGPTHRQFCGLAAELKVHLSFSLFERRAPGLFHNTTVVAGPDGREVGRYRKAHIPDDPCFFEKYYFTPGEAAGLGTVVGGAGLCAGLLICWDQWFPEAARLCTLAGAEVLLYPTAIGWHDDEPAEERGRQVDAWRTVQRAHAITNGVFVAAANRVGREGALTFWGRSFIADPGGRVIAEGPAEEEAVIMAELDLSLIERQRVAWPHLRDRRIDGYAGLLDRWGR